MEYLNRALTREWRAPAVLDATAAAGEKYRVALPEFFKNVEILRMGIEYAADVGAGLVTAGVITLYKNGVAITGATQTVVDGSTQGQRNTETDLNTTSSSVHTAANKYNTADSFPTYTTASDDYLTIHTTTQGVGGTQSIYPYLIYRVKPQDYTA